MSDYCRFKKGCAGRKGGYDVNPKSKSQHFCFILGCRKLFYLLKNLSKYEILETLNDKVHKMQVVTKGQMRNFSFTVQLFFVCFSFILCKQTGR